jgi:hypothetical protein
MRPGWAIREKWKISDEKGESDMFLCLEFQMLQPRLCQLRTVSVELDDTLSYLQDV